MTKTRSAPPITSSISVPARASTAVTSSPTGPLQAILDTPKSLTGKYLRGEVQIPVPKTRRSASRGWVTIHGARENNLKNIERPHSRSGC